MVQTHAAQQGGVIIISTHPIRRSDITVKDIGDETLLYNAKEKVIHVLNPTAKLIWELCDGGHTLDEMEEMMRANFAVPAEHDAAADIRRTLETFASKGLVEA